MSEMKTAAQLAAEEINRIAASNEDLLSDRQLAAIISRHCPSGDVEHAESAAALYEREAMSAAKTVAALRETWGDVFSFLSDDQGFIYDSNSAECQTCGAKAATIEAIKHKDECFTEAVQKLCAALASVPAEPSKFNIMAGLAAEFETRCHELMNALKEAHNIMHSWFSSEYADHEVSLRISAEIKKGVIPLQPRYGHAGSVQSSPERQCQVGASLSASPPQVDTTLEQAASEYVKHCDVDANRYDAFLAGYAHARKSQPTQGVNEFSYSSTQATRCAGCNEHKHTPIRNDDMGGYVCLTCIDKELSRLQGRSEQQIEMRRILALIELENQVARRESDLGGWLSDHTGAIQELDAEYQKLRAAESAAVPNESMEKELAEALHLMLKIHGNPKREEWMNDGAFDFAVTGTNHVRDVLARFDAKEGGK